MKQAVKLKPFAGDGTLTLVMTHEGLKSTVSLLFAENILCSQVLLIVFHAPQSLMPEAQASISFHVLIPRKDLGGVFQSGFCEDPDRLKS